VALPAVAAQQVEAAVVADARVGVGGHVVDVRVGERTFGEGGPGDRRLRVAAYDVLHLVARIELGGRGVGGEERRRWAGHQVVVGHAASVPWVPGA
jgi:hypothetical protein